MKLKAGCPCGQKSPWHIDLLSCLNSLPPLLCRMRWIPPLNCMGEIFNFMCSAIPTERFVYFIGFTSSVWAQHSYISLISDTSCVLVIKGFITVREAIAALFTVVD